MLTCFNQVSVDQSVSQTQSCRCHCGSLFVVGGGLLFQKVPPKNTYQNISISGSLAPPPTRPFTLLASHVLRSCTDSLLMSSRSSESEATTPIKIERFLCPFRSVSPTLLSRIPRGIRLIPNSVRKTRFCFLIGVCPHFSDS